MRDYTLGVLTPAAFFDPGVALEVLFAGYLIIGIWFATMGLFLNLNKGDAHYPVTARIAAWCVVVVIAPPTIAWRMFKAASKSKATKRED